jgi:hypothetical protein
MSEREETIEGKSCMSGVSHTKCPYRFSHVCRLKWEQSRTHAGCSRNNNVHPYKFLWVELGLYRLMLGDLIMSYRWSAIYLWAEDISGMFMRFGFLICMVIGEQDCSQFW